MIEFCEGNSLFLRFLIVSGGFFGLFGGFFGGFGVRLGFFDTLDHHVSLGNTGQDMLVVHAETLVGGESIDADLDTIYDAKEADTATAFHKARAHFTVVGPSFFDARSWNDINLEGIPVESQAKHTFVDVEHDGLAAAVEGLIGFVALGFEFLGKFVSGLFLENEGATENPPDDGENSWYHGSKDSASATITEAEITESIAEGADDNWYEDVTK